jgi:hypothetical protein
MLIPASSKSQKLHVCLGVTLCALLLLILLVPEILQAQASGSFALERQ